MKKRIFRKAFLVTMVLVMVIAMSASAFAANINYTVSFTAEGNNGSTYNPWSSVETVIPANIPLNSKYYFTKNGVNYVNDPAVNPLVTRSSVMDALLKAIQIRGLSKTTDLDLNPMYGNPGAFIRDVGYLTAYNQYNEWQDENGQWWGNSVGAGWQAYITPAGGTEAGATSYLSSIAVNEGDSIRFDYRTYNYTWKIPGPTQ